MSRYIYSIIRCLPDPRTGEFVNYGAIAGNPATGDWDIRHLKRTSDRIRRFAGIPALETASAFTLHLGSEITTRRARMEAGGAPLGEDWLMEMHHDHRGVIQFSQPAPILANSAREALDLVFEHLISHPVTYPPQTSELVSERLANGLVTQARPALVKKGALTKKLRDVYRNVDIDPSLVRRSPSVFVGSHINYTVDFAIANGHAVQLTQAWSFRSSGLDRVSIQVKAWGYALERLRQGEEARVVDEANNHVSTINRNVDLQVVIASPETEEQNIVYEEAQEVFDRLSAEVHPLEEAEAVGTRAVALLPHM